MITKMSDLGSETGSKEEEQNVDENIESEVAKKDEITNKISQISSQMTDLEFGVVNITNNIKTLDTNIDQALLEASIWNLQILEQTNATQKLEAEEDT